MMRTRLTVPLTSLSLIACLGAQQGPGLSGSWTATEQAPASLAAAPTPILGQQLVLRQDGGKLTIMRRMRDVPVTATYPLDGSEVHSRVPGGLCMGDSESVETATREGNAIALTTVGAIPAGGGPLVKSAVKRTLRLEGPDTLVVEGIVREGAQNTPRSAGTVYRRTSESMAPSAALAAPKAKATIAQLAWLSGVWTGPSGSDERWTPAAAGSMLAIGRTVRNGVMSEFEFLCIAEREGGLVYQAMPNGRSPATDFMLTHIEAQSATFENPAHDFPQMIRYTLRPDDTLEAIVSAGPKDRGLTFTFKRQN